MTVPLCQNWPEEFISDFTNEGEYYSLQTVLGSGSLFKPFPRPEGQGMNSLYVIRQCHYATIGSKNLFPMVQSMNSLYVIRRCNYTTVGPKNLFLIYK